MSSSDGEPDPRWREHLLAAHANRELDARERGELRQLASSDARAASEIEAVEEVHALFDAERDLLQVAALPVEPWEEIDPLWRRLAPRAGAEGQALRRRLLARERTPDARTPDARPPDARTPDSSTSDGHTSSERTWTVRTTLPRAAATARRVAAAVLAAAAIVLVSFWIGRGSRPPDLVPTAPDRTTLGNFVMIAPRLGPDSRTLSWQPVIGARSYDVTVQDGAGNVVLRRDDAEAPSTEWTITSEQFRELERQPGPLSVRVVARDGAELPIGSSGDQPLSLVR